MWSLVINEPDLLVDTALVGPLVGSGLHMVIEFISSFFNQYPSEKNIHSIRKIHLAFKNLGHNKWRNHISLIF